MMIFRHPKYYKELRKRNKLAESRQPVVGGQQQSDQAISTSGSTERSDKRSPGPGHKQQASSSKQQASLKHQAPEASSDKHQAPSNKHQA